MPHMPTKGEIDHLEPQYMPLFGTVTERNFQEEIRSTEL